MTSIKEQIRAEIERQFVNTRDYRCEDWVDKREYKHGKYDAYKELLSYLDTLPEQPMKGLEEAAEEYRRESYRKSVLPNIDGPMPEYGGSIKDAFIAGAEWGAKQVKSND